MREGGLTAVGFLIVLGPTLLRAFGIGMPSPEDQAKYQGWGDIDGSTIVKPGGAPVTEQDKKDDISKGQSL